MTHMAGFWREYADRLPIDPGTSLANRIERALASAPVKIQRRLLERVGRWMEPKPLLWKLLPGDRLRLFFPVRGRPDRIEEGDVVAIVMLYDVNEERALYAHPVHAGPGANPLMQHLDGPMAQPKAQEGDNGDRATRRLLQHKRAIWDEFLRERESLDPGQASERWRERYAWSLVRLYFCERCPGCRWGSPFFSGVDGTEHLSSAGVDAPAALLMQGWQALDEQIRKSTAWNIEDHYAQRGDFRLARRPNLMTPLDDKNVVAVYPSDAGFIDGGVLVGAVVFLHRPSAEVRTVHCLCAGPEVEMLFRQGARALGLPALQGGAARLERYARWRAEAWSRFWLAELELGIHEASQRWSAGFQQALRDLLVVPAGTARWREDHGNILRHSS